MRPTKIPTPLLAIALTALLAGCFPLPDPYYDFLPNATGGRLQRMGRPEVEQHEIEFEVEGVRTAVSITGGFGPTNVNLRVNVPAGSNAHFTAPNLSLATTYWTLDVPLTEPPALVPRSKLPPNLVRQSAPPTRVDATTTAAGAPAAASGNGSLMVRLRVNAPDANAYELQLPDMEIDGKPTFHFPVIHFARVTHVGWNNPL